MKIIRLAYPSIKKTKNLYVNDAIKNVRVQI